MTNRKLVLIAVLVFSAFSAVAQKQATGVKHATAKTVAPLDSYTINFQDTAVGQTATEDCYFTCFFKAGSQLNACDYSGTIELVKSANPPFRTLNLRKTTVSTPGCGGTPVTPPVTLQAGEQLLQDFTFTPTAPGSYRDSFSYNLTPTASPTVEFDWVVIGATPAAPPQITSFAAVPNSLRPGQQTTLTWTTNNALSVSIDNGIGAQPQSGSVTVSPTQTTTYTLTATNTVASSTSTVTVSVVSTPTLVVNALPAPIVQLANTGGTSTSFIVANTGGAASTVTATGGSFFSVSPTSFSLGAGATQTVTVTANNLAAGVFEGSATVSGTGFTPQLIVPVKALSTAPPSGSVIAKPVTNRVDTSATTSGTVSFTNSGNATLTGVLVSDVPWLTPQGGVVTIPPNSTATFTFTIDRTKRSDAGVGSTAGSISLVYLSGTGKKGILDATPPPSVSLVTVVDTPPLTVTNGAPPPLAAGEVALFVPGVGHITGSVGVFISDLSILNPPGNPPLSDVKFFYSGAGGATGNQKSTSLPAVGNVSVALADVVKNVFTSDAQVGSLQIRSAKATKLVVNTNIFNSSNPAGTYGTSIPTFRSDRAVTPGDHLVLSGIRQDTGAHTNFFIQETSGIGVTVQTQFFDANGTSLGTRSDTVNSFALSQINSPAPTGTVAAIMTNTSTGNGTFLAYATPVDNVSGDNWSVADWSRQFAYSGDGPVIIPVAGVLNGANNTFFRTDVTITNTGTASAAGTLEFFPRGGTPVTRSISLGGRQSTILNDVIGTFFGAANGSVGYLLFTPTTGAFALTNRTYTTAAGSTGTFGSAAPVLAASSMLTTGSLRAIGSLSDSAKTTTVAATPATFRTNIGMVETSGNAATVRVTLTFSFPSGGKLQASGTAFKDYPLAANQFLQVNSAVADILGASRDSLGDLRGLEFDFQVISGTGAVAVYASSIDNGTGDSILRTE